MLDLLDLLSPVLRAYCPTPCAGCQAPRGPLCPDCRDALDARTPWSRAPSGLWRPGLAPGARIVTLGPYHGPLRAMVVEAKRGGNPRLAELLGAWGAEALARAPGLLAGADALTLPPPRPDRPHPAGALARALGIRAGLPVLPRLLHRRPGGDRVRFLAGVERRGQVERNLLSGAPPPPEIRAVVLVDDVVTTGATLGHSARLLRHRGLHVLGAVALAFTPRSSSRPPRRDPPAAGAHL